MVRKLSRHRYVTDRHRWLFSFTESIAGAKVYVDRSATYDYAVDPDRRLISIRPDLTDPELLHALAVTAATVVFGPDANPELAPFPLRLVHSEGVA